MEVVLSESKAVGTKISVKENGKEVGRAFLYVMRNDLHEAPFGFLEDVFVNDEARGTGVGKVLLERVMMLAREYGCYKLIATSRHGRQTVHDWYKRLGFARHGVEFRLDLAI